MNFVSLNTIPFSIILGQFLNDINWNLISSNNYIMSINKRTDASLTNSYSSKSWMREGGMNMWKPCRKALICGWMALVIRSSVTSWTYSACKKQICGSLLYCGYNISSKDALLSHGMCITIYLSSPTLWSLSQIPHSVILRPLFKRKHTAGMYVYNIYIYICGRMSKLVDITSKKYIHEKFLKVFGDDFFL